LYYNKTKQKIKGKKKIYTNVSIFLSERSFSSVFSIVIGNIIAGEERRRSHRRGIIVRSVERFDFVDDNCNV